MEESLNIPNFNPKTWLTSNLELATPDFLDVQISELNFNLGLYKNQLEENIINSQTAIQTKAECINTNLKDLSKEYVDLQEYLENQVNIQNGLNNIKINENLFAEINEISLMKTRLNDTLQLMDLIMSLDFHLEEIIVLLEEKNLKDLEQKVQSLSELFKLIGKLPFLDSRREKFELIVQKIKEFLIQVLLEIFNENERVSLDICLVYKILKVLSMEYLFIEYYNKTRFERNYKNFIEACKSYNNENLDFIEYFCETIKKEIDYFSDLFTNKLAELMSEIIKENSIKLMKYLIDNFYNKAFNNNEYQDKIMNFLTSYLKICKFLMNQIENGTIISKSDINAIENACFSIFSSISHNVLNNEFLHNGKILLKKIRKDFEKNQEFQTFEEKLMNFNLLKLPEVIEFSFHRVHELLFGTELEEWIINFQKISEEIFQKFNRLLDELEFKSFNHAILDNLLIFSKNSTIIKKDEIFSNTSEINDKKLNNVTVSENLSLIELLLNKYEELSYLEETINKLDKDIRVKIIENKTSNFIDLFIKGQKFLLETNKNVGNKRKTLILSLKTGLVIFEGLLNGVNTCKRKIKKLLLKIFLADSYNKLLEIIVLPVWKENENIKVFMNFEKITEQIQGICQNFFIHMQIFEEIKKSLLRNSIVYNHLDNLDITNKTIILNELYLNKLQYEVYMYENDNELNLAGSPMKIKNSEKNCDLVKFWGTIYVHFLIKILCFSLKNINEIGVLGKKQLKMDIEYVMNVLNDYLSDGSRVILEDLLNFLKVNENKKIVYLKGFSQSDLGFI